jgi:DNA-binding transcriptional MerR regulator
MAQYSKRDIAKILGRSHRNITYWTDFGLVIPDIQPSQGRGIARIYSDRNLIEFAMIDIMVKVMKVSLDTIQYILKNLRAGFCIEWEKQIAISGRAEPIKFHDFFINQDWGTKKDLLFIEYYLIDVVEHPITTPDGRDLIEFETDIFQTGASHFYIVDKKKKTNWEKIIQVDVDYAIAQTGNYMLWLGKIKHQAMAKYGIEYTEPGF